MSEFFKPVDFSTQYKKIMQVGITSFMLFLAGCGPISGPSNIEAVNAQSSTPILSPSEASCDGRVSDEVANARQNDAQILKDNNSLEEVRRLMASFCDGVVPPQK